MKFKRMTIKKFSILTDTTTYRIEIQSCIKYKNQDNSEINPKSEIQSHQTGACSRKTTKYKKYT